MRPIHVSAIAGLSLAMFGTAQAELEGSVHVGINTEYIWRGIDQAPGATDSMFEAGLDVGLGTVAGWDVGIGVWYASVHGASAFDEVDYYIGFSREFGCLTASLTYTYYDFPSSFPNTNLGEVAFGLGTSLGAFDIGATYFWDVEGDNDGYSELTIDRSFDLCDSCSLDIGATVSYDFETTDVHHYGVSAALNYAVNDVLTVTPYVSVTWAEDGAQNGVLSLSGSEDDEVFGGLLVSAAF